MGESELIYGKTREELADLVGQIFHFKASVLGKPGPNGEKSPSGSGVMVESEGFHRGVLTARHVVFDCLISGELTTERSGVQGVHTVKPTRILCLGPYDSAVLVLERENPPRLCEGPDRWARAALEVGPEEPVVMLGTPGEMRSEDGQLRQSDSTALPYVTNIKGEAKEDRPFKCEVHSDPQMPSSLAGMSGGAVHDLDGHFLGILLEESKGADRHVTVLPTSCLKMYRACPGEAMKTAQSHSTQTVAVEYDAVHRSGKPTRIRVHADLREQAVGQEGTSPRSMAGVGCLTEVRFLIPEGASQYRIDTQALFEWSSEEGSPWLEPLGDQVGKLLGAGALKVRTVNPMIVPPRIR